MIDMLKLKTINKYHYDFLKLQLCKLETKAKFDKHIAASCLRYRNGLFKSLGTCERILFSWGYKTMQQK